MQPIDEFMQQYFSQRAELHKDMAAQNEPFRKQFFTPEYSETMQRSQDVVQSFALEHPPKVINVQQTESSAVVTTTEPVLDRHVSFRYHLHAAGTSWLIRQREWECFVCKGTGTKAGGACKRCNGTGWKHYDA